MPYTPKSVAIQSCDDACGSTTMSFTGTSGRLPLMSVQLAPKSVLRKTWGRGSSQRKPEIVTYETVASFGSIATRVTEWA